MKYLPIALTLVAFSAAGTVPALADFGIASQSGNTPAVTRTIDQPSTRLVAPRPLYLYSGTVSVGPDMGAGSQS